MTVVPGGSKILVIVQLAAQTIASTLILSFMSTTNRDSRIVTGWLEVLIGRVGFAALTLRRITLAARLVARATTGIESSSRISD